MENSVNFNFMDNGRYPLTRGTIERIKNDIFETYGINVTRVEEDGNSYIFVSEQGIVVGDVTFIPDLGQYRKFNYHHGALEEINKRKNKANKKHFRLTKNEKGVGITADSIAVLTDLGAVRVSREASNEDDVVVEDIAETVVTDANDLVLNAWAKYAMDLVEEGLVDSDNEYARMVAGELKNKYYNSAMMNYYNYIDKIESALPKELTKDLVEKYHTAFRNDCYALDEALENSFYSYATFDESPFADAVVFDRNGSIVTSGELVGECKNFNGDLLLPGHEYTVYVKASLVPGNNYTLNNLPVNTRFVSGEAYVAQEHLNDFIKKDN